MHPVVGVILTILRLVSTSGSGSSSAARTSSAAEMRSRFEAERQAELNRQKNEAMQAELNRQRQQQAYARNQQVQNRGVYTNPYYQEQTAKNAEKKASQKSASAANRTQSGAYRGLLTGGIIFAAIAGFTLLFAGLAVDSFLSFVGALSIPVLIAAAFFVGAKLVKDRDTEMGRMKKMIGQKESYNLSKLASASGKSLKKVRKQLQKMIDRGEFGDTAYIDLGTNNFMRNPDAEPDNPDAFDYRTVYGDLFAKKIEEEQKNGENMKKSKENIESILDLLVVGFEQQVDQLFRNESIDITADISVLETMMQKDGLGGKSDFDLASYIREAENAAASGSVPEPSAGEETFTDGWTDEIGDGLGGGAMGLPKPKK